MITNLKIYTKTLFESILLEKDDPLPITNRFLNEGADFFKGFVETFMSKYLDYVGNLNIDYNFNNVLINTNTNKATYSVNINPPISSNFLKPQRTTQYGNMTDFKSNAGDLKSLINFNDFIVKYRGGLLKGGEIIYFNNNPKLNLDNLPENIESIQMDLILNNEYFKYDRTDNDIYEYPIDWYDENINWTDFNKNQKSIFNNIMVLYKSLQFLSNISNYAKKYIKIDGKPISDNDLNSLISLKPNTPTTIESVIWDFPRLESLANEILNTTKVIPLSSSDFNYLTYYLKKLINLPIKYNNGNSNTSYFNDTKNLKFENLLNYLINNKDEFIEKIKLYNTNNDASAVDYELIKSTNDTFSKLLEDSYKKYIEDFEGYIAKDPHKQSQQDYYNIVTFGNKDNKLDEPLYIDNNNNITSNPEEAKTYNSLNQCKKARENLLKNNEKLNEYGFWLCLGNNKLQSTNESVLEEDNKTIRRNAKLLAQQTVKDYNSNSKDTSKLTNHIHDDQIDQSNEHIKSLQEKLNKLTKKYDELLNLLNPELNETQENLFKELLNKEKEITKVKANINKLIYDETLIKYNEQLKDAKLSLTNSYTGKQKKLMDTIKEINKKITNNLNNETDNTDDKKTAIKLVNKLQKSYTDEQKELIHKISKIDLDIRNLNDKIKQTNLSINQYKIDINNNMEELKNNLDILYQEKLDLLNNNKEDFKHIFYVKASKYNNLTPNSFNKEQEEIQTQLHQLNSEIKSVKQQIYQEYDNIRNIKQFYKNKQQQKSEPQNNKLSNEDYIKLLNKFGGIKPNDTSNIKSNKPTNIKKDTDIDDDVADLLGFDED